MAVSVDIHRAWLQVLKLYELTKVTPWEQQVYREAWDLRRLYTFSFRRQLDAFKREQTPRDQGCETCDREIMGKRSCLQWFSESSFKLPKLQDPRVAELFELIAGYREQWAMAAECFQGTKKIADEADDDDDGPKIAPGDDKDCYWEKSDLKASGSDSGKKAKKKAKKKPAMKVDDDDDNSNPASETKSAGKPKTKPASSEKLEDGAADDLDGLSATELEELQRVEAKIRELEAEAARLGHDVWSMSVGGPSRMLFRLRHPVRQGKTLPGEPGGWRLTCNVRASSTPEYPR